MHFLILKQSRVRLRYFPLDRHMLFFFSSLWENDTALAGAKYQSRAQGAWERQGPARVCTARRNDEVSFYQSRPASCHSDRLHKKRTQSLSLWKDTSCFPLPATNLLSFGPWLHSLWGGAALPCLVWTGKIITIVCVCRWSTEALWASLASFLHTESVLDVVNRTVQQKTPLSVDQAKLVRFARLERQG